MRLEHNTVQPNIQQIYNATFELARVHFLSMVLQRVGVVMSNSALGILIKKATKTVFIHYQARESLVIIQIEKLHFLPLV